MQRLSAQDKIESVLLQYAPALCTVEIIARDAVLTKKYTAEVLTELFQAEICRREKVKFSRNSSEFAYGLI
jgi:hypothetical protein